MSPTPSRAIAPLFSGLVFAALGVASFGPGPYVIPGLTATVAVNE